MWSYERDCRWWGWSFVRGSTVLPFKIYNGNRRKTTYSHAVAWQYNDVYVLYWSCMNMYIVLSNKVSSSNVPSLSRQAFMVKMFWGLFALPSPKQRHHPKCKSQMSRSATYDLLVEVVKNDLRNYEVLHELVMKQHNKGTRYSSSPFWHCQHSYVFSVIRRVYFRVVL